MTYYINSDGLIYDGDAAFGDSEATAPEITAWQTALATEDVVRDECYARIEAVVSAQAQANIQSYVNSLLALVVVDAGTLTTEQEDDIADARLLQTWLSDMVAEIATLTGDPAYQDDVNWPTLPEGLSTFIAGF